MSLLAKKQKLHHYARESLWLNFFLFLFFFAGSNSTHQGNISPLFLPFGLLSSIGELGVQPQGLPIWK